MHLQDEIDRYGDGVDAVGGLLKMTKVQACEGERAGARAQGPLSQVEAGPEQCFERR